MAFEGLSELQELDDRHTLADALQLWVEKHEDELYPGPLAVRVNIEEPSAHSTIEIGLLEQDEQNAQTIKEPVVRTYASQWTVDSHFDPRSSLPA